MADAEPLSATSYAYEYCLSHSDPACIAQSPLLPAGDFMRSVRWSPDGSALAAATDSGALQIHDLTAVVDAYYHHHSHAQANELLLSQAHTLRPPSSTALLAYAWYPHMHSSAPETCCVVESARDHPVQLRDTRSGRVRASYPAMSDVDAPMTASAVEFTANGESFLAGYAASVARFDVARPGLPVVQRATAPSRRSPDGMKGVVSSIAVRGGLAACATFSGHLGLKSALGLDDVATWRVPPEYRGAGVTDLRWSGEHLLWAAQRRAQWLVAWDVRDLRSPVAAVRRPADTMQRLAIDADGTGRHLVAGQAGSGALTFYDCTIATTTGDDESSAVMSFVAADDVVAAVSAHPYYPLLATASGQRQFPSGDDDDDDADGCKVAAPKQNCLKIWSLDAHYFSK
ncbi:hypothetical protein GGF42_005459 [Coemansia sp. RSA 2424]|nr:hypothetical protein GGF42_005459 [Coemansia sp. RSA 2424]